MITADDIRWFKEQFAVEVEPALRGTPFTVDLIVALACQETGHIWSRLRRTPVPVAQILELCVGDTLDATGGRRAFPTTKAELLAVENGAAMFGIARQALERMAAVVPGFTRAAAQPHKFCHAFGIFQFDLQHFRTEPAYFLERRYVRFDASLRKCLDELRRALARNGLAGRTSLSDLELAGVAIAYNAGRFRPERGLKQGHFDGQKFYGEQVFDFLRLSKTVALPDRASPDIAPRPPGFAPVPPPTPVDEGGRIFEVDVRDTPLRLRSAPTAASSGAPTNVIARLPDGQLVRAVAARAIDGFLEVETSLNGAHLRGFASRAFLKPVPERDVVPVPTPASAEPATGITAVSMPRRAGTVTRRTAPAGAHSLNEANQPARQGATPDDLRTDIAAIVDWLAVDVAAHRRYQPRNGQTFCNIYAHDYCHLAGAYLPRVWWTPGAIEALAQGRRVEPQFDRTIHEQRANDLFRWLRDFGLRFGWRQTGTLTKLQLEVNQGAIGLIVARRRDDGRPGHIAVVIPETVDDRARRDAAGEVVAPLQSQAGSTNVRRGTGRVNWWKGEAFADSAFWLHA